MALGSNHVIASEIQNFVPELWSDEVLAAYKSNLVLSNLVRKLNHRGKKGDTIRIPTPTRGTVSDKAAETAVTLIQHGTDAGVTILIDKHKEYSRLIEDLASVQGLESLRRFYTDDGGYAIAHQVDRDLFHEAFRTGSASITVSGNTLTTASTFDTIREGDGTTWDETACTDITDAGIRAFIKVLDDVDAPQRGRVLVVPTIVKQDLLGLSRFTEQAFVGNGDTIRNGLVGDVYGSEVFVTTRTPLVQDSGGTPDNVAGLYFQQDALVLVEQLGVRTQSQYKLEWLGDLFVADMIYGVKAVRGTSIVTFVVPTT